MGFFRHTWLVAKFLLLVALPVPIFLARAPWTIYRTLRSTVGRSLEWSRAQFLAFSSLDLAPRCWYLKIADSLHRYPLSGYVWDDGFGCPLGSRFYNNWATYRVLQVFGAPVSLGLGYLLGAFAMGVVMAVEGLSLAALCAILIVLASPIWISSQIFYGKPETFWWFSGPLVIYCLLHEKWLTAGLLWSAVTAVNIPAAVTLGGVSGFAVLLWGGNPAEWKPVVTGFLPGIVLAGTRILPALFAGFATRVRRAQKEEKQAKGTPLPPILLLSTYYLPLPVLLGIGGYGWRHVAFALLPLVLYWTIFFVFYFNDPAPIVALMFSVHAGYQALTKDLSFAGAGLVFAFGSPLAFPYTLWLFREDAPRERGVVSLVKNYANPEWLSKLCRKLVAFPQFTAITREDLRRISVGFAEVPPFSRILLEPDGRGPKAFGYRGLVNFLDYQLSLQNVELVPDEYVMLFHRETHGRLQQVCPSPQGAARWVRLAQTVGARYVLAISADMADFLTKHGHRPMQVIDCRDVAEPWKAVTDHEKLYLFELADGGAVVEPPVEFRRDPKSLTWRASAGTSYLIRHAYERRFRAVRSLDGTPVAIAEAPVEDLPALSFMRITPDADGEVSLIYGRRKPR